MPSERRAPTIKLLKEAGAAFIRSWRPAAPLDTRFVSRHIRPQDITAIQTVSRIVTSQSDKNKTPRIFTEFQVNLCKADNERYNAFVTLDAKKANQSGSLLTQILGAKLEAH